MLHVPFNDVNHSVSPKISPLFDRLAPAMHDYTYSHCMGHQRHIGVHIFLLGNYICSCQRC